MNLETWEVIAEQGIDNCDWVDEEVLADSDVTPNCEIEMTAAEAEALANAILTAVKQIRSQ